MAPIIVVVLLGLLVAPNWAANLGQVGIKINGKVHTKYVISGNWARSYVKVSPNNITLSGGGRVYLADSNLDAITAESFYHVPLLGRRLTYTVDMSRVGCSCNAALYALAMPAHNSSKLPAPGENGEFYCDADKLTGYYCPDMDIMEANKFAMASTAHACLSDTPPYYPTCDRQGCGKNVLEVDQESYGPGKRINTNKPFTVSVSFVVGDKNLTKVSNAFYQDDQVLSFNSCNSYYLPRIGPNLASMVVTMSIWGVPHPGGMKWLDGKSGCQGGCDVKGFRVVFSDFQLDDLY